LGLRGTDHTELGCSNGQGRGAEEMPAMVIYGFKRIELIDDMHLR
jgi:hypothetical protein